MAKSLPSLGLTGTFGQVANLSATAIIGGLLVWLICIGEMSRKEERHILRVEIGKLDDRLDSLEKQVARLQTSVETDTEATKTINRALWAITAELRRIKGEKE